MYCFGRQEALIAAINPPPQMDANRAFQAHNLETLEAALQQSNIALPPSQVGQFELCRCSVLPLLRHATHPEIIVCWFERWQVR